MNKKKLTFYLLIFMAIVFIPSTVKAQTIDEIKTSGKLIAKSIPFSNYDDMMIYGEMFGMENPGYYIDDCDEKFETCKLMYQGEEVREVEIKYQYDEAVKKVVDKITEKIPEDGKIFKLTDIEYISYTLFMDSLEEYRDINLGTYSSELRKYIGYKNFVVEPRMGDEGEFFLFQSGTATFTYNGVIYAYANGIGVRGNGIVYIDSDATNIEEAVKERLSKFFDIESVEKIGVTKQDYLDHLDDEAEEFYNENNFLYDEYPTLESYQEFMRKTNYEDEDSYLYEIKDALDDIYLITFKDGSEMLVFVAKDSEKAKAYSNTKLISTDVETDVTITADEFVPLDTLIKVAKITDGEEYDKIVKILKSTDIEIFDLKLFSNSIDDYVTSLEDGSFEVKIPIKDEFKDKDLTIYYVDEDGKTQKYDVTVKDGYAYFYTDHFSVYTLVATEKEDTPQTYDSIKKDVVLLLISVVGMTGIVYLKKKAII